MALTEEQKRRIDQKKAEAMARLKNKQSQSTNSISNQLPNSTSASKQNFGANSAGSKSNFSANPAGSKTNFGANLAGSKPNFGANSAGSKSNFGANSVGNVNSISSNGNNCNSLKPQSFSSPSIGKPVSNHSDNSNVPSVGFNQNSGMSCQSTAPGQLSNAQKQAIEQKRLEAIQRRNNATVSTAKGPNTAADGKISSAKSPSNSIVNYFQETKKSGGTSASNFYSNSNALATKPPNNNQSFGNSVGNKSSGLGTNNTFANYLQNFNNHSSDHKGTQVKSNQEKIQVCFSLVQRTRFEVRSRYHEGMIKIFKAMKTSQYNAKTRIWSFHIEEHDQVIKGLGAMRDEIQVTPLPHSVLDTFSKPRDYGMDEISLDSIEQTITDSLMPFQVEGIKYAISRGGRVLIADDMGLGKTIQALGLASYYMDAWPFLVVAPSSMRYAWETAILRWFPFLTPEHITIISKGKDFIGDSAAVIISYDLLSKKSKELVAKGFNFVIMDESHCIKNDKSARTKAAEPLMQKTKYLILLSGTPALSRPMELFSQISALQPRLFKYARDFGFRYCNGQIKNIGPREVYDFTGSSNMEELALLLQERCMIRRLKSDVLQQLPSKQRCMVQLDPSSVDNTSKVMREKERAAKRINVSGGEKRACLLEWYSASAQAKLKAVQEYVGDLLGNDKKFLLFCHHQVMMTGLKEVLDNKGTDYIVIDGSTPSDVRKVNVDRFQTVDKCQVALLSITAANSGLTLTSAQLVVFAEIYWNPGILTQAEDRAHRIGQTDSVTVQYLVAKGTADDELWPMIKKKLDVLNKAGLSKDNFEDSESKEVTSKGQKRIDDFFGTADDSFPEDMFDDDAWDEELEAIELPKAKKLKS